MESVVMKTSSTKTQTAKKIEFAERFAGEFMERLRECILDRFPEYEDNREQAQIAYMTILSMMRHADQLRDDGALYLALDMLNYKGYEIKGGGWE